MSGAVVGAGEGVSMGSRQWRSQTKYGAAVLVAVALGVAPVRAVGAQQEFPQTLYWGSGLIDIPVAWVPTISGDFALAYSGKLFRSDPISMQLGYGDKTNSQFTLSSAVFGRVEGGVAFFSSNPEYGFFIRG